MSKQTNIVVLHQCSDLIKQLRKSLIEAEGRTLRRAENSTPSNDKSSRRDVQNTPGNVSDELFQACVTKWITKIEIIQDELLKDIQAINNST